MKNPQRPFLIAITGSIASGKSTVSKWFENKGYEVFYADRIGHEILKNPDIISDLENEFSSEILTKGKINRRKLGEIVFSNPEKLKFLNDLLHPKIRAEMQKMIDNSNSEILFFEIPLLFENGLEKSFDLTINISTKQENLIQRLKNRNGLSKAEIQRKIATQMTDEEKQERADVNIVNNKEINNLYQKLEEFCNTLKDLPFKQVERLLEI